MDFHQDILLLISDFLPDESFAIWSITGKTCQTLLKDIEVERQTALSSSARAQLLNALQVDEKDASAFWEAMDADDAWMMGDTLLHFMKPTLFPRQLNGLSFRMTENVRHSELAAFFQKTITFRVQIGRQRFSVSTFYTSFLLH
jgi:hypothetical protein